MTRDVKIKTALICLMLICLFKLPYGAYSLIRYVLLIGFGYLAYEANDAKQEKACIIYIILAVLFQPIFKIPLGRTIWNIVDLVVVVGLALIILRPSLVNKQR